MTQITISDGTTTITMPRTKKVSDAGELVYTEKQMASGLRVRDIKGFRPGFKYEWDFVPATTATALMQLLRTGGFFTVNYFDVDGADKSGTFSIDYPSPGVFKFKDGVAMWHGFTLAIKSQGVV